MKTQYGFTLIELMMVIAIIAILSGISIPTYQQYIQKAAMTDMLQIATPYKMAVELCKVEQGHLQECQTGSKGIPVGSTSRYVSRLQVNSGVIHLTGAQNLQELNVELIPKEDPSGLLRWTRRCTSNNSSLQAICQGIFRFDDAE